MKQHARTLILIPIVFVIVALYLYWWDNREPTIYTRGKVDWIWIGTGAVLLNLIVSFLTEVLLRGTMSLRAFITTHQSIFIAVAWAVCFAGYWFYTGGELPPVYEPGYPFPALP